MLYFFARDKCVSKKSNIDDFIAKSRVIHGNNYDYSQVIYINNKTPVQILCAIHGKFYMRPDMHVTRKQGCPFCGKVKSIANRTKSRDQFIKDAREIHGNRYNYDRVEYVNSLTKVQIGSSDGSWFWQTPANHLSGHNSIKERNENFKNTYVGSDTIKKMKETNLEKYGVSIPTQNSLIYNKIKQTNLKKYGVEFSSQKHLSIDTIDKLNDKEYLSSALDLENVTDLSKRLGVDATTIYRYGRLHGIFDGYMSNIERSLGEFLESIEVKFQLHNRTILDGDEIDFYIPEKKIAIEMNGLFWHSEISGAKGRRYHYDKWKRCRYVGVDLITIFEDEWYSRKNAVTTILKTRLGRQKVSYGARKLSLKEIDFKIANTFFENYHIQSGTITSVAIGAFHDDELVSVMGFGHPVRQSCYDAELKRFCTNGNIYPGIASKLFTFYKRNYSDSSIVSFCDNRWFNGNSYIKMGFINDSEIPPDYTYTNDYKTRNHKSNYRISRLKKRLNENFDKTEWEVMKNQGYDRIWDCGKIRFVWKR